jgi:Na+-transporting NADH:ubiquinone oxidoreductase subunit C
MNRNSPGYMLGFMTALCVVFGSGVATVHYATRDRLAANERLQHNRVVCAAFGLPTAGRAPTDYARAMAHHLSVARIEDEAGSRLIYRQNKAPQRVGFTFAGMGFWDRIEGFVVLAPDLKTIAGLRFFDHKETPGLGARIEDEKFLNSFAGLRVDWDGPPERRIVIGTAPASAAGNRVDAITGATQTSGALMRFFNEELERIRAIQMDTLDFQPVREEGEQP